MTRSPAMLATVRFTILDHREAMAVLVTSAVFLIGVLALVEMVA